jgi:hypothetical protein
MQPSYSLIKCKHETHIPSTAFWPTRELVAHWLRVCRCRSQCVQLPLPDDSFKECTAKEDIEAACLAKNDRRFSQSKDTPFLTEPLLHDFGLLGHPSTIDEVLQGTYPTTNRGPTRPTPTWLPSATPRNPDLRHDSYLA